MESSFTFGPFILMPQRQMLTVDGRPVRIGGRALDILTCLVSRAGELVTKRDLIAHVWPGRVVEEGNLKVNVAALRRALGDDAAEARYVTTVNGLGYRFVEPVADRPREHAAQSSLARADADAPRTFAFGPFVLIPERHQLLADGVEVRIGGRALEILKVLVRRAGELVTKRELLEQVWPGAVVEEGNLKANMTALRQALGDGAGAARYIATVTGRGYRFIEAVRAGDAIPAPPEVAPCARVRHNLPTVRTCLFGRMGIVEALRGRLEVDRLVSIVGAGGIGKTSVAMAVAEQAVRSFIDGAWLIDLATVRDPKQVPGAIAAVLGLVTHGPATLAMTCACIRDREMLLVLDSCEHLVDSVATCVQQLLEAVPRLRILVTSREPLRLRGEHVCLLPLLATPPVVPVPDAAMALAFPAIQLFVDRACDTLDGFALSDENVGVVAAICRRLDGLALAIELAATRVDAFGVDGLLRQLDDRLSLPAERRGGPPRQRTLAATLAWSYDLLSPREAALLRAVSVFAQAFDARAAARVAGIAPPEAADTLALLATKSLLVMELDAEGTAYRFLETTRAWCLEHV